MTFQIKIIPQAMQVRYIKTPLHYSNTTVRDDCPICASKKIKTLTELVNKDERVCLERSICGECDHIFFSVLPSSQWFENFYQNVWDTSTSAPTSPPEFNYAAITDILTRYISHSSRIMDLGCGYGSAIDHFQKLGYKNLLGLEPSARRASVARKTGAEIFECTAEHFSKINRVTIDAAYSWHAFEHMEDPLRVLKHIYESMSDGGVIFLCVPNADAEHLFSMAHFIPHQHSFSVKSALRLLNLAGFEVVYIDDSIRVVGTKKSIGAGTVSRASNFFRTDGDGITKKFIRDFSLRNYPKGQTDQIFDFSAYRGNREILEPSYGRFQPKNRHPIRNFVRRNLVRSIFGFGSVCKRPRWLISRIRSRFSASRDEYRLWGEVMVKKGSECDSSRLTIQYLQDFVYAWTK